MNFISFPKLISKNEEIFSPHLLVRARWALVFFMAIVLMLFVEVQAITFQQFSSSVIILLLVILFNNFQESRKVRVLGNFGQLLIDLCFISLIIFINGGDRNPFSFLLILTSLFTPLFLEFKQSVVLLLLSILSLYIQSFSTYQFWHTSEFLDINFLITTVVMSSLWTFMSWFSYIISRSREYLEEVVKRDLRISRLQTIGALTSGFCHELGTPLGSMRLCVDRIKSGRGNDFDIKVLEESLQTCEVALKSMVMQSQNDEKLEFNEVDISQVLQDVASSFSENHSSVEIDTSNAKDIYVLGSRISFYRLFFDLFENSVDAGASNITVRVDKKVDTYIMSVNDNGAGFPESVVENLGTPFNSTKKNGMGIGLYNAMTYVDLLGGHMEVSNSNGTIIKMSFKR